MNDSAEKRWERQPKSARRKTIIEVAARQFARMSYDAVSMAALAAEAGVNRGLIHHYVGTKRDLYKEVLMTTMRIPQIPPLAARGGADDFAETVNLAIEHWLDGIEANKETFGVGLKLWFGGTNDREIESIVTNAREDAIDEALKVFYTDPARAPQAIRGALAASSAYAGQAVLEWLQGGRLNRAQVKILVVNVVMTIVASTPELVSLDAPT